jgi:hypothetical protein
MMDRVKKSGFKYIFEINGTGIPHLRGRLSTVDLLVLTILDWLLFILKILFKCVP